MENKVKFLIIVFICQLCVFSCTNYYTNEDIVTIKGEKRIASNNRIFSGELRGFRDNGSISSIYNYVEGYRYGDWSHFGYKGDTIQYGEYIDDSELFSMLSQSVKTEKILFNKSYEGEKLTFYMEFYYPDKKIDTLFVREKWSDAINQVFDNYHPNSVSLLAFNDSWNTIYFENRSFSAGASK